MAAKDTMFKVVSPLGSSNFNIIPISSRISNLEGVKIGFIWNIFANGDVLADAFANLLEKRFKNVKSIKLPSGKKLKWSDYPDPSIKDVVKEAGIDAVIVTAGC